MQAPLYIRQNITKDSADPSHNAILAYRARPQLQLRDDLLSLCYNKENITRALGRDKINKVQDLRG